MTYFYNQAARLRELDARSQTNNIIKRRMDNYRIGMVDPAEEELHAKSGLELSQTAAAQAQLFEKQVGELFKHPQDAMEFKRLFPVNDIPYLGAILSKLQLMFRGSSPAPKTVSDVASAQISQLMETPTTGIPNNPTKNKAIAKTPAAKKHQGAPVAAVAKRYDSSAVESTNPPAVAVAKELTYCDVCDERLQLSSWKTHITTAKHKRNFIKLRADQEKQDAHEEKYSTPVKGTPSKKLSRRVAREQNEQNVILAPF